MAKDVISVRIEESIIRRARLEAKKENRPIGNYIETVLIKHFNTIDKTKNPTE
ncbi:MAG: hypothetical protein PHE56_16685 [Bacteroidales bacterium]|nr:hypothetical protein [Bacteroidales bacterium]